MIEVTSDTVVFAAALFAMFVAAPAFALVVLRRTNSRLMMATVSPFAALALFVAGWFAAIQLISEHDWATGIALAAGMQLVLFGGVVFLVAIVLSVAIGFVIKARREAEEVN